MQLSKSPIKTIRETTKKFDSRNHELLLRGGFVDQMASGIYSFLPLGLQVLTKIENIVRKHMNNTGAQEILLPKLQPKNVMSLSGRWDDVDVLYKITSQLEQEFGLAYTAEEAVTELAKSFIRSYRDLPLCLYQIDTKFRDEVRSKSGILRGREFRMKDAYSFHNDKHNFEQFYQQMKQVYLDIYREIGFTDVKVTEASGGMFSKENSHEFNVLTPAGEVELVYFEDETIAYNEEVVSDKMYSDLQKKGDVKKGKAIEIGNIFSLGVKFSESQGLKFADTNGKLRSPYMGSYGVGTSRILGAIVETSNDEHGIIWPKNITPAQVHLVALGKDMAYAGVVYRTLTSWGIDVLFDDRENVGAGEKLSTADFLGIPLRIVVSEKTGRDVEIKERTEEKSHLVTLDSVKGLVEDYYMTL